MRWLFFNRKFLLKLQLFILHLIETFNWKLPITNYFVIVKLNGYFSNDFLKTILNY